MNRLLEARLQAKIVEMEAAAPVYANAAERYAYNNRLRRAREALAKLRGRHNVAEWEAIVAETGGICVRCGTKPGRIHRGHIVPICQGGSDAIDNLQPVCHHCAPAAAGEGINWLEAWRETNGKGA